MLLQTVVWKYDFAKARCFFVAVLLPVQENKENKQIPEKEQQKMKTTAGEDEIIDAQQVGIELKTNLRVCYGGVKL